MKPSMRTMTLWVILVALSIGFVAGRLWTPSGIGATTTTGSPVPEATATREAELEELERLRTQVAQAETVCAEPTNTVTPSPTITPTPVPPVAAGQPLPYGENWTVEVLELSSATLVDEETPEGVFIVVTMTITNNEATERLFPFEEFVLVDEQGRPFVIDVRATILHPGGVGTRHRFLPSLPTDTAIVFDVAEDAGTTFILESTADPTFRVQLSLEMRG
jgi:hypothetical protein